MKLNWGSGIALFITGFLAMILSLVFKVSSIESDLYAEDYYAQELDYQRRIDAKQNAQGLKDEFKILLKEDGLELVFPKEMKQEGLQGRLYFYRPDNAALDYELDLNVQDGIQFISNDSFIPGNYQLMVEWKVNKQAFLVEQNIVIK